VCYDLSDPDTFRRETAALEVAMKELSLNESTLISYTERKEIATTNGTIRVIPVIDWLMAES
jgi:predicted AAA+ superfamily ATPase